jgi:predicted CXXCH cytochrome family protein
MFMRSVSTKTSSKIILVLLLLALINCAAEKRYKVLTVFFDGVPKPGEKKEQEKTKSQEQTGRQTNKPQAEVIQIISRHPGYRDGKCNDCHDRSAANFLRTSRDTLCFTCHDQGDFQGAFVHGPVAVNDCLSCHLPHESRYAKLLIKKNEEICLYCHLGEDIAQNPAHSNTSTACSRCHYAHAAANRFFLKNTALTPGGK